MSFNWKLYYNLAEYLIKDHNPEMDDAWIRTSISRSYYGTYGLACELIRGDGIALPGVDTHKFVRDKYITSSDINLKRIGEGLGNLHFWRKKADYKKEITLTHNNSKFLLSQAKHTIELLVEMKQTNIHFNPTS